jgi:hypothetical protein
MYHWVDATNSRTSVRTCSAMPSSRTTECSGRRRRGVPKGRHSVPQFVYTIVVASCFAAACACASARKDWKSSRPLPMAVSLTHSHGCPVCRSTVACSRTRSTTSTRPSYHITWRPGHGVNSNRVALLPLANRCVTVSTVMCWLTLDRERCACVVSHCNTQGYALSFDVTSSVTSKWRWAMVMAAFPAPRRAARPVPRMPSPKPALK